MSRVEELESAVARLSDEELAAFAAWFEAYHADAWDRQIKADAEAGRLDALFREAEDDIATGRVRPLP
jgi:hypothetical protein